VPRPAGRSRGGRECHDDAPHRHGDAAAPERDAAAVARDAAALHQASGGRLDLGVGLGYRDEEFDGVGLARRDRGRRMEEGLRILHETWADPAISGAGQLPHPPVWMGGMAGPALERGARWGCDFMLPPTLSVEQVAAAVSRIQEAAEKAGRPRGRIGMIKDAWVDRDGDRARADFLPALTSVYREYGSWWVFKGEFSGYERPDLVEQQVARSTATALVGDPGEIAGELAALADAGVDVVALHLNRAATRSRLEDALRLTASEILPTIERNRP
jgi:alkanesulfonate monooxygenase SsuD/methylene tetrahydromethanopterin reductase-like flavin-dependent oxidoreductase (luciferase family)